VSRAGALAAVLATAALLAGCGGSGSGGAGAGPSGSGSGSSANGAGASAAGGAPRKVASLVLPSQPVARSVRVPILTYHRVHVLATEFKQSIPDETVEPSVFAAEIAALDRAGYHSITQAQLYGALFRGAALPARPVLITVDDGYVDDVKQILPVLRAHRMVATFYIITARFHEQGFLNPTEVRRLDAAGMDIGAHTRTHADLPLLGAAQMRAEIEGSRRDLQRVLGHFVYFFAYPYGAENPAVVDAVRQAGFSLAVTTQGGTQESSLSSLTMPRIHIGRSSTPQSILACMSAAAGSGCGGGGG
jgi:peptidoglycan/xylan/chitin deacetylase (PgdA/CDA1 family)